MHMLSDKQSGGMLLVLASMLLASLSGGERLRGLVMERWAESDVESVAAASTLNAANYSFAMEMQLKNIECSPVQWSDAPTAENVAGSGLNLACLRTIFLRDGEDGLSNTFTCKNKEDPCHQL